MRASRDWLGAALGIASVALLGLAGVGGAAAECVVPPADMVGWWTGDGDAVDLVFGNNASMEGGATFAPGLVGQAFRFGPGSQEVVIPSTPSLNPANAITIDAWVKPFSFPNNYPSVVRKDNRGYPLGFSQYLIALTDTPSEPGQAHCHIAEVNAGSVVGGHVPLNEWTHLACTYDRVAVRLYVNGAEVASTGFSDPIPNHGNNPVAIGNEHSFAGLFVNDRNNDRSFDGLIDEVEIFDRALSAAEILAIYQAGSSGKCKVATASAGPDQGVDEGDLVVLDGAGSADPFDRPLTYVWRQVAGATATLDGTDPVHPRFTAPLVASGGQTLTFELTVSSSTGTSAPDTVDVLVRNVNHAPVADAGDDPSVAEGSLVTLDGAASYDPDLEALTFAWLQIAGTAVTLSDPGAAQPTLVAPSVGPAGETLTFELTVGDGLASDSDTVSVAVANLNQPPTAAAGADQTVSEGTAVTLSASGSADPDGNPLSYGWTQVSGLSVTLSDVTASAPTFDAPEVGAGGTDLVFRLVVGDGMAASAPDDVTVHVLNVDDPPVCSLAQARLAQAGSVPGAVSLWPPNHKLVAVEIVGVSDPDDDQVTLSILAVTQDEPVNGSGDGDTSPDAVVQGSRVLLRAERSANGNGRVYRVHFSADDGQGGVCTGTVSVSAPGDRRGTGSDDGQSYDSLVP